MPRAPPPLPPPPLLLLPLLLALALGARAADVFVIADTANQTSAIAAAVNETVAEAADLALNSNDTLTDSVVRKKRTFGDIVFRGLADVLGYQVARKAPQVTFPPPLAPVPGIDAPLQAPQRQDAPLQIPFGLLPLAAAPQADPAPCGRVAAPAPAPCAPPPPPPPPPKPNAAPPCPKPRANPKPTPKPKPKPKPKPPPPPPCGSGKANPTTAAPCAVAKPKADAGSNLETFNSNIRLDFNFNRQPASAASQASQAIGEQPAQEQPSRQGQGLELQQDTPAAPVVAIRPQAARLPPDPPRKPRVYLDAYVVQNGVTQKIQTVDAKNAVQHQADNDFLQYDDPADDERAAPPSAPSQQDKPEDDYDYVQNSKERSKTVMEFGTAVDQFWGTKNNRKNEVPAYDYRAAHFGDRSLAGDDETHQALGRQRGAPAQPADDDEEPTTTTQDPRRRLKPRVLPPTENNPNQIDIVTVRVPPIYKEKRPRKLHRGRTDAPPAEPERDDSPYEPYDYSYPGSDASGYYRGFGYDSQPYSRASDAESENSEPVHQTERPRRRRRKHKRKTRSTHSQRYTAGDYDYYGKKLPISQEEEYFRGLTIPPPTRDPDVVRLERAQAGDGHFLDDHERLRDESERIKDEGKKSDDKDADESEDGERSGEAERTEEKERSGEKERADSGEKSDRLSPKARVRETAYKNNFVRAHNVRVADNQPLVRSVRRKKLKQT